MPIQRGLKMQARWGFRYYSISNLIDWQKLEDFRAVQSSPFGYNSRDKRSLDKNTAWGMWTIPEWIVLKIRYHFLVFRSQQSFTEIFCRCPGSWWQWKIIKCCCRCPDCCCNYFFCCSCCRCSCPCCCFWTNFIWFQFRNIFFWCGLKLLNTLIWRAIRRALVEDVHTSLLTRILPVLYIQQ